MVRKRLLSGLLAATLLLGNSGLEPSAAGAQAGGGGPPIAPVAAPRAAPLPMPVISRGVPAFSSGEGDPPGWANDADYATQWGSVGVPTWLAYDLSGVPVDRRGRAVVAWYNNEARPYDAAVLRTNAAFIPRAYLVEANAAPSGPVAPALGWVALASATGNTNHSRQHIVDLAGYNWLRVVVTESIGQEAVRLNLDLHDASRGVEDAWIFLGDSITAGAMQISPIGSIGTFAQLVNARLPAYFPAQESGGIDGLTSGDGARLVPTWLAAFPGRYVGLSYGTNDANRGERPETFYANYEAMVRAVLGAGKIPVVPKIPWSLRSAVQQNAPALNTKLERLYAAYPEIIPGPDLWTFFRERPDLISSDALHPTARGYAAYREYWADTMIQRVYLRGK